MKNKQCFLNIIIGLILSLTSFIGYGYDYNIARPVNDAAMTAVIKTKYAQNPLLNIFDIHVETNHGIVKLTDWLTAMPNTNALLFLPKILMELVMLTAPI